MNASITPLVERFANLYPHEVARIMEPFDSDESAEIIEDMTPKNAAAVLSRLTLHAGAELVGSLPLGQASRVVEIVEPSRAAAVLSRMPRDAAARILEGTSPACRRDLGMLMRYPVDSAGRLMDPLVITMLPDATVEQALARVRGLFPRRVFNVYLVDQDGLLSGAAHLQNIATAKPGTRLADIAERETARVRDTATRQEVVEAIEGQKAPSLPVVDFSDRVVGVIRYAGLMQTLEREASADIQTMVGVSKDERALSSVGFVVKKRLPWLQINLATAFVAAAVVGLFEETIAGFTALAVLLPVVAGQSGNTGAQALAVIMRGLSLREITPRQAPRVLSKEVTVAILNGIAVAFVTGAGVLVWSGSSGLAAVTAVAMVISMGLAGLAGAAIPLVLQLMGQDPAQSSSIILTTVTDVTGFFSFLGLATLFSSFL